MSNARAKAFLAQKQVQDRRNLLEQWEDLQEQNVNAQGKSGIGRMIGNALGLGIAGIVGMPLWGAMLASGLGSRLGAEAGEHHQGGAFSFDFSGPGVQGKEAIDPVGTGYSLRKEIEGYAEDAYGQFDTEQDISALTDAASAFTLGGGMIGTGESITGQLGKEVTMDSLLGKSLQSMFKRDNS
jgi:hypothetical protein